MDAIEPFLWIAIFILLSHIIFIKLDVKQLEERLDTYKEMLDIQNQKIDEIWRYTNKF
ncbi:hypothetical protein [Bacillus thuringiensis]|uniref:hypothetical protein n=1 Tax=Bacillus thuringiensis TaxID=1428 RepID=UPI001559739E|nr:hypothetical protein [Bacillus thuringiensis]